MRMSRWMVHMCTALSLSLGVACGSDKKADDGDAGTAGAGDDGGGGGSDGAACNSLCTGAGFESGAELDFGQVVECVCTGSAAGIAKKACEAYCSAFEVRAEFSYLSMNTSANDKCVCDGTQEPVGDGDADAGGDGPDEVKVELDANGFPVVPDDALTAPNTGIILLSVTDSASAFLGNGTYVAPNNFTNSSISGAAFQLGPPAPTDSVSLQVNLNVQFEKQSGTFACDAVTDLLVRYGMPPSGTNQLLSVTCAGEYTYDAETNTFTGNVTATMADGLSEPSQTATATIKATFAYVYNG
jgi:hypothetical protein